nr:hypothetical protein [Tanacetum cinerariifolium]
TLNGLTTVTVAVRIVPHHTMYQPVTRVASLTEAKANKSPIRAAGRLNTRNKTRNLSLKEITNTKGPVPIRFEVCDKHTLMPLGEHTAHWSSYIGETQFDMRPHMESPDLTKIHVASSSTGKKHTIPTMLLSRPSIRGRAQPLRSTRRSLIPSSWHTLLTENSFWMRIDVYTGSGECGDDEESADDQDDENEDGDGDS